MRWRIFLSVMVLGACGCWSRAEDTVQSIPGLYVTEYQSVYARSRDTLLIRAQGERSFLITRRSYHEYVSKEHARSPVYRIVHWMAVWQPEESVLVVPANGRRLIVDRSGNEIRMGIRSYQKQR